MSDSIFLSAGAFKGLCKLVEQKTVETQAEFSTIALFGMPIHILPSWVKTGEQGYPDWQERLERNLNRSSMGKWEPLTFHLPDAYLVRSDWLTNPITNPKHFAAIYDWAGSE